jgi:uncharacterized membrane protein
MPLQPHSHRKIGLSLATATAIFAAGTIGLALHVESVLREPELARALLGEGSWRAIVIALGGRATQRPGSLEVEVPFVPLVVATGILGILAWLGGAGWISRRLKIPFSEALDRWGRWGWIWWLLPAIWELMGITADLSGSTSFRVIWQDTLPICHSVLWTGWLTAFFTLILRTRPAQSEISEATRNGRMPRFVWVAMAAYFVCFAAMNWMLYKALLVPHGDSAMYEEHVWNLLHGKGFRSYLDNGRLFLGEHVQVIHLFVIPLYVLWPSHLLLELCQSACLALGAIPVFRMANRHSNSKTAAALLAVAYLLYFPMQYLDIAITFKTFRPNSFEIPFLLFALDALERCRYRTMLVWLTMTLLCQEDAATVIAPLGIWIALRQTGSIRSDLRTDGAPSEISFTDRRRLVAGGLGMALFGILYVVAVVKIVLPWFRGGADVHFAQYFADLGGTSGAIVKNVLAHPGLLAGKLLSVESLMFAVQLLAPLGFLPLLSPSRLCVAAPLFGVLCLSAITNSPFHHFHAPLVPILFWAAAAGLAVAARAFHAGSIWWRRRQGSQARDDEARHRIPIEKFISSGKSIWAEPVSDSSAAPLPHAARRPQPLNPRIVVTVAVWTVLSAFFVGLTATLTPLGFGFWDPYSRLFWRKLYVPGERARYFPAVLALVPSDSRVASTDYIHPRFTHYARSYDYSHYRPDVPEDCEYIVIDTRHPYSDIQRPAQVKEFRDHPDEWELLEDHTEGYFIVLKRRNLQTPHSAAAN